MKLMVTQSNLAKALNVVSRVAASRTTLPILSNILIKAENKSVVISSTNLEVAITCTVPGKIEVEGSITVPARLMNDFVSSLPDGNIQLSLENQSLRVSTDKYESTINGISADEFPSLPEIDSSNTSKVSSTELKSALQQTVFAASSDESRQVLTAVFMHTYEGKIFVVATDSYRLAEREVGESENEFELLVPALTFQELLRLIGDDDQEIKYSFDESQIMFKHGEIEVISRLIDGKYPDYRQLIPRKGEIEFKIKKADFVNIAKVSSLFAKESAGSITLDVDDDKQEVSIRSIASQVGENNSVADAEVKGSGSVTLNSRYLIEALNAINGDEINFSFSSKTSPCVLSSVSNDNYIHVVMPLRS